LNAEEEESLLSAQRIYVGFAQQVVKPL
jgi:hypothetical protein